MRTVWFIEVNGAHFKLRSGITRIGTNPNCDIILDHEKVLPYHLKIKIYRNTVSISNFDNEGFTLLNGDWMPESITVTSNSLIEINELPVWLYKFSILPGTEFHDQREPVNAVRPIFRTPPTRSPSPFPLMVEISDSE